MNDAGHPRESAPRQAPTRPRVCWWPAGVIVGLGAGAVAGIRASLFVSQQHQNLATGVAVILTLLSLLLWCLLASRLPWRIRLAVLGGVVMVVGLAAALVRIRGVTGDLVPIFEFRWGRPQAVEGSGQGPRTVAPAVLPAGGADFPQFLGPTRNATLTGPRLARDWTVQPPQRLWLQRVGTGWSGFAVVGGLALTQEQRGENEVVVCYDLLTGREVWSHADAVRHDTTLGGEGPRATPTVASNRVFALGATGILNCLELATGRRLWSKNLVADNQSHVPEWGVSGSPLVLGDLVIVSAGGHESRSLVAYRVATGEFVWGGGDASSGYSSPLLATLAGAPQVLIFNASGVVAHDPANGQVLWKHPWRGGHPHVAMPVVLPEDRVLVSSGYGTGSEMLKVSRDAGGRFSAARLWKSTRLKAKFTNPIHFQGHIYGLDDGILVCLDAATGAQNWKEGRYGHGQNLLVGDLLLVTAESGEVVLLEPNPEAPRELTRFVALRSKTWNPPALAGEYLLVRNDKEAACYRLPTHP
jgi:outer membrane protein assembly factor BamB